MGGLDGSKEGDEIEEAGLFQNNHLSPCTWLYTITIIIPNTFLI